MDNPRSRSHNDRSHVGPRSTGGMASERRTGATANLGNEIPKAFDAKGTIGKKFTGVYLPFLFNNSLERLKS